jgi:hypothetical protein
MQSKRIRFDYLSLWNIVIDGDQAKYQKADMNGLLVNLSRENYENRLKIINGNGVVLTKIETKEIGVKGSKITVWYLQFAKIRETILPSIINNHGKFHPLLLSNDESLAEFTNVIYDNKTGVMFIQRNQNGSSPSLVRMYLNKFCESMHLEISAVIAPQNLKKFVDGTVVRGLKFTATSSINDGDPSIKALAKQARETGAKTFEYNLSVGRAKKDKSLLLSWVRPFINRASKKDEVSVLKVKAKLPTSKYFETFDLIEDRCSNFYNFDYDRENPITSERIFVTMETLLLEDYSEVLSNIGA